MHTRPLPLVQNFAFFIVISSIVTFLLLLCHIIIIHFLTLIMFLFDVILFLLLFCLRFALLCVKTQPKNDSLPPLPLLHVDPIACHSHQQTTTVTNTLAFLFPIKNTIVPVSNLTFCCSKSMCSLPRYRRLCLLLTSRATHDDFSFD